MVLALHRSLHSHASVGMSGTHACNGKHDNAFTLAACTCSGWRSRRVRHTMNRNKTTCLVITTAALCGPVAQSVLQVCIAWTAEQAISTTLTGRNSRMGECLPEQPASQDSSCNDTWYTTCNKADSRNVVDSLGIAFLEKRCLGIFR